MIEFFEIKNKKICSVPSVQTLSHDISWIDLLNPTTEEENKTEGFLNIDIPTREEMKGIETSNRLYKEGDALFMTANILTGANTNSPQSAPVTFVLMYEKLVTLRYIESSSFDIFLERAKKSQIPVENSENILVGLLEIIVDRLSDPLEDMAVNIDNLSRDIFQAPIENKKPDFDALLRTIGQKADLNSKVKESLVSLDRLVTFLCLHTETDKKLQNNNIIRLKSLEQDIRSLTEHASFLSNKINFLLQATLGMISIEQNAIIKFFSVAAVIFLPPTLIASIYGMNFSAMPELTWAFGYPVTLVVMLLSAILPYLFFRHKGWL
jgi:magnesium transporter